MELFVNIGTGSLKKDTVDSMYTYIKEQFLPTLKPLNFRPSTKEECDEFLDKYISKNTYACLSRDVIDMRLICCKVRGEDVDRSKCLQWNHIIDHQLGK